MLDERRLNPRAAVGIPAEVQSKGSSRWGRAVVQNLSASGAALHSALELPLQSEVRLRFELPARGATDARSIETWAIVVHSGTSAPFDSHLPWSAGLHFTTLQGEEFEAVRVFVWGFLHGTTN